MASILLRNSRRIGDYEQPFIVAEINTSHSGKLDVAKEMIKKASELGCDCVKFQSWSAESINSKDYYKENPIAKRFFKKFSMASDQLVELATYSRECGIDFASTPYSPEEVDVLVDQSDVPFIKVASMDLNNHDFLAYIGHKNIPIVLSTGMGDMDEIQAAVNAIEQTGNRNICILHCVSIYPAAPSIIQLNNIIGLREAFPDYPIGFSDHSTGSEMASAATALGAGLVEKHFTLDSGKIGMDNQMATEPDEFGRLVESCHNVYAAMGQKTRTVLPEEVEQRQKMRRSVVAARDLSAGQVLERADLVLKRPGTGIAPERLSEVIGKTLVKDVEGDCLLSEEDFSN